MILVIEKIKNKNTPRLSELREETMNVKIRKLGELAQSAKCLPCKHKDLELMERSWHSGPPVMPELGKQRQAHP